MNINIEFPGGSRVDAHFGTFVVQTDQPPAAAAPSPFELFLASIGTCAGFYVQEFCRKRGISTEGLRIVEHTESGAHGMVERISLEVQLPAGFPQKYRESVIRAAELCTVKKHLERPPSIEVTTAAAATEFATAQ
jgi:putative redox protein